MARCETCGNEYDKSFEVVVAGVSHSFDSFECAIEALAPRCGRCGCRVMGHGVESAGRVYCCAHCASAAGVAGLRDRTLEASRPTSPLDVPSAESLNAVH